MSGIMQSRAWATFKRRLGQRTLHLALLDGGALVGGLIGYLGPGQTGPALLMVPEGPVLPWADEPLARTGLRALVKAVEACAPDLGLIGMRLEPRLAPPAPRVLRAAGRAPVDLLPTETLCLDLAGGPDAVLRQMHPKARYNIRLAARRGVVVRDDTSSAGLAVLLRLLAEAGARGDFFVEPPAFFAALVEALGTAGQARILVAEREGEPLAAMVLVTCGRRATYLYGAVANRQREVMAGYALQWAAMQHAMAGGCSEYDLYGYEPHGAPDHLYAGFSRFKRQFGGRPARLIGARDLFFLDRLADVVVAVANPVAQMRGVAR